MQKKQFIISLFTIFLLLFTLCGCEEENNGNGNSANSELQSITLNLSNTTDLTIGSTITLSYTPDPTNPKKYSGNNYNAKSIEYFVDHDGSSLRISNQATSTSYTFSDSGDFTFWAKYCIHITHSDTVGDLVSNRITVTIKGQQITTVEELKKLANSNNKVELGCDLDISSEDWEPIANFTGRLDGKGHTISGLKINSNKNDSGLFAQLGGSVINLKLKDVSMQISGDTSNIGAICGTNNGTVSDCETSGKISGSYINNVGGIAGYNSGTVKNCVNNISVSGLKNVGGVIGKIIFNKNYSCESNNNTGSVSGSSNIGGIVGFMETDRKFKNYSFTFSKNNNSGMITGTNNCVGGIVGNVTGYVDGSCKYSTSIDSCENSGTIKGVDYVAGIIGYGAQIVSVGACSNTADITGAYYVGGYAGFIDGSISNADNANKISGKAYVGGIAGYCEDINNCNNNGIISSSAIKIEGTNSCCYAGGIAGRCANSKDCTNKTNISISHMGNYIGGIAGFGYSVQNCKNEGRIEAQQGSYVGGILGCSYYTQNLESSNNTNNGSVTATENVGGIIGGIYTNQRFFNYNYSINSNTNSGNINGIGNSIGGIIGKANGHKDGSCKYQFAINGNKNQVSISGKNNVGGIVGYGYIVTTISACENSANITGENYVGSIAGCSAEATISFSENNYTITGKAYIGGIAGRCDTVENSTNNGSIVSNGVIVENSSSCSYVGGIAGRCYSVQSSTNSVNISIGSVSNYVGGITGYATIASNCQNSGRINASQCNYVGGIIGCADFLTTGSFTSDSNKNSGTINGNTHVGGIIGGSFTEKRFISHTYSISNCNNSATISGSSKISGIIGSAVGYKDGSCSLNYIISNNTNSGTITGSISGGILGYGKIIGNTESIWNSNSTIGNLYGTIE